MKTLRTQLKPWTHYRLTTVVLHLLTVWATATAVSAQELPQSVSVTIPHEEFVASGKNNFTFFDKAFYENQFFLLGESHGVQKPQELDFALLKHLNERVGVRHYIAEVDQSKAYYLNQYLQTGNDSTLMKVFRSWIATREQWANKDFYQKIERIRALNQTLPKNRQITFVGIDRIQEHRLVAEHLTELLAGRSLPAGAQPLADTVLNRLLNRRPDSLRAQAAQNWLNHLNANEKVYTKALGTVLPDVKHILTNVVYLKTLRREATIFTNFQTMVQRLNLQREKLYGFWGFYHVLQAPVSTGAKPFAALVRESDLPMAKKMVSLACLYVDCYMMLPSAYLPPMWQTPGKTFSRVNQFNNNGEMMYTEGIEKFIGQSRPNSLTLFDLQGTQAANQSVRMRYSPFMPKEQQLKFDESRPTTDYFQYLVLVRDSDMTRPLID